MTENTTALTWAGLTPGEYAEKVSARARENVEKIPAEHRGEVQRFRLRVVDDHVDHEALYAYEGSRFTPPEDAIEHVREGYRAEYAHGLYEIEPVYLRYPGDREQTVAFGEPLVDLPEEDAYEGYDGDSEWDSDPLDDGTIGYDYYGPSWPTRDI